MAEKSRRRMMLEQSLNDDPADSFLRYGLAIQCLREGDVAEGRQLYLDMVVLHPRASLAKRRAVGLPDVAGLLVHSVESGGRAEEAGFQKGDLICAVEDEPVSSTMELRKALNRQRPRSKRFRVLRGAETVELRIDTRE